MSKINLTSNQNRYKAIELLCEINGITTEVLADYIKTGVLPKSKVEANPKTETKVEVEAEADVKAEAKPTRKPRTKSK